MRAQRACLIMILSLAFLSWALPSCADQPPDYAVPSRFAWPWACGDGHRVTWGPQEHLYFGKARGIAFDFAMAPGTPLYAPDNGIAHLLLDERPFDTNFGNYIEIVTLDGDWLIRLAHLRDIQSGERPVVAGELIGYSGSSGVSAAHLHLEILLWDGAEWVRPDVDQFEGFFGVPIADLVEGAIVTQDRCEAQAAMNGTVRTLNEHITLSDEAHLVVPLLNEGLEPLDIDTIQVLLRHESGRTWVMETDESSRDLAPKAEDVFVVSGIPTHAGKWQVSYVTYQGKQQSGRLPAEGELTVHTLPLVAHDLQMSDKILSIGDPIAFEVSLTNRGDRALAFDDLFVRGTRPDDTVWEARLGTATALAAQAANRFRLTSSVVPQQIGVWDVFEIGFQHDGQSFHLDDTQYAFAVFGPELRIDQVHTSSSEHALTVLLTVTNVGTATASPNAIEVWGWQADGETPFVMLQKHILPIAPGASKVVLLTRPMAGMEEGWRLVQAGQWTDGAYYALALASQPGTHSARASVPVP